MPVAAMNFWRALSTTGGGGVLLLELLSFLQAIKNRLAKVNKRIEIFMGGNVSEALKVNKI